MSKVPEDYNKGGYYTFLGSMAFVVIFFIVLIAMMPAMDLGQNIQGPAGANEDIANDSAEASDKDNVEERIDSLGPPTDKQDPDDAAEGEE